MYSVNKSWTDRFGRFKETFVVVNVMFPVLINGNLVVKTFFHGSNKCPKTLSSVSSPHYAEEKGIRVGEHKLETSSSFSSQISQETTCLLF